MRVQFKSKINKAMLIISICILSACVKQPLYNYEDYSESYYSYKKNMTNKSLLSLQKAIEEAINNSKNCRSGRVPPGMYANLGYLLLKNNKSKEAIKNFNKEKAIYPESIHFMDRMIRKVESLEGEN